MSEGRKQMATDYHTIRLSHYRKTKNGNYPGAASILVDPTQNGGSSENRHGCFSPRGNRASVTGNY
jgi:hypothetical protein